MIKKQSKMFCVYLLLLTILKVNSVEITGLKIGQKDKEEYKLENFPLYKTIMIKDAECGDECGPGKKTGAMVIVITNGVLTAIMDNPVLPTIGYFMGILQVSLRSAFNQNAALFFLAANSGFYAWGRVTEGIYGEDESVAGENFIVKSTVNVRMLFCMAQLCAEKTRHMLNVMKRPSQQDDPVGRACNKYILPLMIGGTNSIMPIFQLSEFASIFLPLSIVQDIDAENAVLLLVVNVFVFLTFGHETDLSNILNSIPLAGICAFLRVIFYKYRNKVLANKKAQIPLLNNKCARVSQKL